MSTQFKPILFSTPMVQAILEERKTQTRRVIKNIHPDSEYYPKLNLLGYTFVEPDGKIKVPEMASVIDGKYKVGDILWVRETWCLCTPYGPEEYYYGYKVDSGVQIKASDKYDYQSPDIWKPSIHMPKTACRLFLRITNVRVERLHDISDTDVMNEGAQDSLYAFSELATPPKPGWMRQGFERLWTRINGTESWNANPWVWVIEFERVEKPTNF